jgi:hypothetical protein
MDDEMKTFLLLKQECEKRFVPRDFWEFWSSYFNSKPSIRHVYKSSLLKYNFYAKLLREFIESKNVNLRIE